MRTIGLSPKVWVPVAAQAIALIVNLISTGQFDRVEIAQLVGIALTAVVGYIASPGEVEYDLGPDSDALLEEKVPADPAAAYEAAEDQ